MFNRLYQWTLSLAESPHAPWALGIIAFAESSFFPIPPDVKVDEHLKDSQTGALLYKKKSSELVAQFLVLDRDLSGTDLAAIIQRIAERAKALADS